MFSNPFFKSEKSDTQPPPPLKQEENVNTISTLDSNGSSTNGSKSSKKVKKEFVNVFEEIKKYKSMPPNTNLEVKLAQLFKIVEYSYIEQRAELKKSNLFGSKSGSSYGSRTGSSSSNPIDLVEDVVWNKPTEKRRKLNDQQSPYIEYARLVAGFLHRDMSDLIHIEKKNESVEYDFKPMLSSGFSLCMQYTRKFMTPEGFDQYQKPDELFTKIVDFDRSMIIYIARYTALIMVDNTLGKTNKYTTKMMIEHEIQEREGILQDVFYILHRMKILRQDLEIEYFSS